MHPFASYVLRSYYQASGWNEDNLYANLTRSSNAILDFTVPRGLHLSVSKSPNALFRTTYSMNAMPSLNGTVGYIFTSCPLDVKNSGDVRFKDMIERFKIYDQPRRPEDKEEVWLAGERVDARDYLLYGRFYLPAGRLDALYSTRLSPTLQGMIAAISDPRPQRGNSRTSNASNVMFSLQHDVGRWGTEYTWSAEDGMLGARILHNFGKLATQSEHVDENEAALSNPSLRRVDEEEPIDGGLRGRISAGAELYFSAKEKSAGVSTGIRFTTLPDATPPSIQLQSPNSLSLTSYRVPPSQPPTTITALFNPMLGHVSGAYACKVARDLSLASRFDFNCYSFESEWTMGAEWWLRRPIQKPASDLLDVNSTGNAPASDQVGQSEPSSTRGDVRGVVKVRASTSNNVAIMWEGRLNNMLLSLGVAADLSNRIKPIRTIGLELSYFSSG